VPPNVAGQTVVCRDWSGHPPPYEFRKLWTSVKVSGTEELGAHLDTSKWWQNHGFLSNVAASATTACFGLPFALIVLDRLGSLRDQVEGRRKATLLKRRAIEEFVASVDRLQRGPVPWRP
jgi:hypothetical protein